MEAPVNGGSGGNGLGWWTKRAQARERLRLVMDRSHHGSEMDASRHSLWSQHSNLSGGGEQEDGAAGVVVEEVVEAGGGGGGVGGAGASGDAARVDRNWARVRTAVTMLSKARLEELMEPPPPAATEAGPAVGAAGAARNASSAGGPPPLPPRSHSRPQAQRSVRWSREGDIDRQPSSSALAGQQQQQQQQSGAEGGAAMVAAPLMARSSISRSNSIAIPPERLLVEGGRLSSPEGGEEDAISMVRI